jgi:prephenate dehydratase
MKRVAILGPSTFSEEATRHFLGEDFTYVSYKLISEVFNATASGETELGVFRSFACRLARSRG